MARTDRYPLTFKAANSMTYSGCGSSSFTPEQFERDTQTFSDDQMQVAEEWLALLSGGQLEFVASPWEYDEDEGPDFDTYVPALDANLTFELANVNPASPILNYLYDRPAV